MTRRGVVVLGSTGSIGTQALQVCEEHPDRFEVVGLAAGRDAQGLAAQAARWGVDDLALADPSASRRLRELLPSARVRDGMAGVSELAGHPDAQLVVNAVTGARGLGPTLAALAARTPVALANKESLIVGGDLVIAAAERAGGRERMLVPVDSEHSALAQCLRGGTRSEVARLVLTASGGPFRGRGRDELATVTLAEALAHPTWDMGPVITVNSATLMNKGLELIEAHLLFAVGWDRLDVVVHPQSVVHSMVEFVDGSTIAQLSPPDMRLPIQLAMAWPDRLDHAFVTMDWSRAQELTFEPVDRGTFRALALAEDAGRRHGTFPAVLNAANEQAVAAFLDERIGFSDIPEVVATVLDRHASHPTGSPDTLAGVLHADGWAREVADDLLRSGPTSTSRPAADVPTNDPRNDPTGAS